MSLSHKTGVKGCPNSRMTYSNVFHRNKDNVFKMPKTISHYICEVDTLPCRLFQTRHRPVRPQHPNSRLDLCPGGRVRIVWLSFLYQEWAGEVFCWIWPAPFFKGSLPIQLKKVQHGSSYARGLCTAHQKKRKCHKVTYVFFAFKALFHSVHVNKALCGWRG